MVWGEYEPEVVELIKYWADSNYSDFFLDIGANIGLISCQVGHLFKPWVDDCPLSYASNNAPNKVNVLGSFLLSILAGHTRYAHLTSLMGIR
jgi:hypothetical protein